MLKNENTEEPFASILSDLTADIANSAVKADLFRPHPRPSKPVTPAPDLDSLRRSPRISIPYVTGAIQRFDITSSGGLDGLYTSVLQAFVKTDELKDPI